MSDLDAVMGRRSIRRYTDEDVTEAQIDVVLRAAMAAPSAGNQQPWRFVVVRDAASRAALSEATPYASMLASAPVAIAICGDTTAEKHPGFWVQDCSAAVENLLVAVNAIGLGAVWVGVHPIAEREDSVRGVLGVPEDIIPFALVAVGHPAEHKPPSERYSELFVHRERWGASS